MKDKNGNEIELLDWANCGFCSGTIKGIGDGLVQIEDDDCSLFVVPREDVEVVLED